MPFYIISGYPYTLLLIARQRVKQTNNLGKCIFYNKIHNVNKLNIPHA